MITFLDRPAHSVLEAAVGVPIEATASVDAFLSAVGSAPWTAAILCLDHGAVDSRLASRVAGVPGAGALFLTSSDRSVSRVLEAERAGAVALLPHPPSEARIRAEIRPLVEETGGTMVPEATDAEGMAVVGSSNALMEVFRVVARVAPTPATVLVTGESGTGKELVAHALHEQGVRSGGPFVAVNCAAIPDTLLEAELFGYEKGAFSGAVAASEGRFGRADGGTMFLDEIGEMSLSLQAKLLRVLETGEVERLGGRESASVDVRIVAATNRPLRGAVNEGRFREDLLFRLAVVEVELPPLRERRGDLVPLAIHFAGEFARRYGRPIRALSDSAIARLTSYSWPGNVRELRNVLDRAVLVSRGGVIRSGDVRLGDDAPRWSPLEAAPSGGYPPTLSLEDVEADHIRRVLAHTDGHMGAAAEILGIHRNTMTAKVRAYGLVSS